MLDAVLPIESADLSSTPRRITADRLPYLLSALLFALVTAIGFARSSVAIATGAIPNVPLIVHVHAALMAAWLILLVIQTASMSTGRRRLHLQLGLASLALAPLMVIGMTATTLEALTARLGGDFPQAGAAAVLLGVRCIVLFSVFYAWAVLTRRSAPETHKRMMIMATFVLIDAGILRMPWLPGNDLSVSVVPAQLYHLLLLAPVLVFDLLKFGAVQRSYLIALALYAPFAMATALLWDSPGWLELVTRVAGLI